MIDEDKNYDNCRLTLIYKLRNKMRKIITILLSFLFISFQSVKAEIGIGVTGAFHSFDASGTETLRQSDKATNGSHSEDVLVPELFIEAIMDNGGALGIAYIPTRELGSKSRTESATVVAGRDNGTYTAKAELDNVVQFYADIPVADFSGGLLYGKVGVQHATISTLESLNSGSTYPDEDVLGVTLGLGIKGDLPYGNNLYYKADITYTDFEDYSADSNSSPANKITADLDDTAMKLSIGYKF